MTQVIALQIIAEASHNRHILAELDSRQCARYKRGGGYRVRLVLKPEHRVLLINNALDWPAIRDTWQELLIA